MGLIISTPLSRDIPLSTERGAGRTTDLIHWAAQEQVSPAPMRYLVCHSMQESSRVFRSAQDMGLQIRFPVTWEEMSRMRGMPRTVEFAIDNLSLILPRLVPGVLAAVVW